MTTAQILESRQTRLMEQIDCILETHQALSSHRHSINIALDGGQVTLTGHLPNAELKKALVSAIRQAGVLGQIRNRIATD